MCPPVNRAAGLCKGNWSTWGSASAPRSSRKPRGLPTCGLFCSWRRALLQRQRLPVLWSGYSCASECSAPHADSRHLWWWGWDSGALLSGWRGLPSPPHPQAWALAGTVGDMQSLWHWGAPLWSRLALPPPVTQKLPARAGTRARF